MRILLIDPDPIFCRTMADVLGQMGHAISTQSQPQADYTPYDLVLGDVSDCPIPHLPITKPVRLAVLLSKIKTICQQMVPLPRIGPWHFDSAARLLRDESGRTLRLTDKETSILDYLLQQTAPVSKEQLLTSVWGYSALVSTHTLETHIYRLRQKIEPDPSLATLLLTEAGGYRCVQIPSEQAVR